MGIAALLGYGWPGGAGLLLVLLTLLLLVFAVTALSLGLAFALPGHIELIAVIFVANLPLLFASTALAPISFMPAWLGWLAALNPLTFAIEPIRAAYAGSFHLTDVVLVAPYGSLSAAACLGILAALAAGSVPADPPDAGSQAHLKRCVCPCPPPGPRSPTSCRRPSAAGTRRPPPGSPASGSIVTG